MKMTNQQQAILSTWKHGLEFCILMKKTNQCLNLSLTICKFQLSSYNIKVQSKNKVMYLWKPILFFIQAEDPQRMFHHGFSRKTQKLIQCLFFLREVERKQNLKVNFMTPPGQVNPDFRKTLSLESETFIRGQISDSQPEQIRFKEQSPQTVLTLCWLLC